MDLTPLTTLINLSLGSVTPGLQLTIIAQGQTVYSQAHGFLDPKHRIPATLESVYDVASLTKLFTAILTLQLVEQGHLQLDQPIAPIIPEFIGARAIQPFEDPLHPGQVITLSPDPRSYDAERVTVQDILTHSSGLPPWRPLFQQGDPASAWHLALTTPFAYPPRTQIAYSDIGFIILGLMIERLTGYSLKHTVQSRILDPLQLKTIRFGPIVSSQQVAPTEYCQWRQRRILGEVHDENAAGLGGVAGHAGLFATAPELALLGQCLLAGGDPVLQPETVVQMIQPQAVDGRIRRGLGVALRVDDPRASSFALSPQAFGHTGFTGTSLWMDPCRQLVVACVTNSLYYGRERDDILAFRVALHQAVVDGLRSVGGRAVC